MATPASSSKVSMVDELITEFKHIDDEILGTRFQRPLDTINLKEKLRTIHQRALRLKMSYIDDVFYDDSHHSKHDHDAPVQLDRLLTLIDTAQQFLDSELQSDQFKTMRRLTLVTTICLPLTIITGFFGMNFQFMGIDKGSSGILRDARAPTILFSASLGSVIIIVILFRLNII